MNYRRLNEPIGEPIWRQDEFMNMGRSYEQPTSDYNKGCEDTLRKVLGIVQEEALDPDTGENEGCEIMSYSSGWMACGFHIEDKIREAYPEIQIEQIIAREDHD